MKGVGQHLLCMGRYQSGQLGQTVTLLSFDFVGSNPALPTFFTIFAAFLNKNAGVAQLVERQPSKLNVASSNLVSRSKEQGRRSQSFFFCLLQRWNFSADVAQG